MATGDVRGNLERLKVQLRSISYPHALDTQGCKDGLPAAILPLVHYALLGYSRHLARYLSVNGYVLYAKSDLRFVECVMKLLRKEFEYRCPLTVAQIFARGFAEKKFLFVHDLIQMCKRKHNDLLRIVRNSEKTRVCQPKAFGRMVHLQQKPSFIRNKHLSSKFDRRCELDLLPDTKCREVCCRNACQENSWVVLAQGKTSLSAISDNEESVRAQSYERVKNHGLRVSARSHHDNVNENCHLHASASEKSSPKTTMMGAQIIHKEHVFGLLYPEPALERNHDYEATSPRSSCQGFNNQKQGITYDGDGTRSCPTTRAPQEDSIEHCKDNTKPHLKSHLSNSTITPDIDHNFESLEKKITHSKIEGKGQAPSIEQHTRLEKTPCPSQESCPHIQLHDNQLSTLEDSEGPNVSSNTMTDNPPQAVWKKIIDLAGKIDMCFCSLDNKIAHSFNSLDNKLETKFKYLDEGVTCTRETLQDKLNTLENRIDNLERTSQISPMSFQTNVTYNEEAHPIRDITNTFNNIVDNGSWRNFTGLQPREPMVYYPNLLYQQQAMQNIQNIPPMYAGLLKASTQDFIANVRARFYQTKESATLEHHQYRTMVGTPRAFFAGGG